MPHLPSGRALHQIRRQAGLYKARPNARPCCTQSGDVRIMHLPPASARHGTYDEGHPQRCRRQIAAGHLSLTDVNIGLPKSTGPEADAWLAVQLLQQTFTVPPRHMSTANKAAMIGHQGPITATKRQAIVNIRRLRSPYRRHRSGAGNDAIRHRFCAPPTALPQRQSMRSGIAPLPQHRLSAGPRAYGMEMRRLCGSRLFTRSSGYAGQADGRAQRHFRASFRRRARSPPRPSPTINLLCPSTSVHHWTPQ